MDTAKTLRRNSKGFSLLELIIVIAIVGLAGAMFGASISEIFSTDAKECASDINSMLSKCKIMSMSRSGNVYLALRRGDDGLYADYYEGDAATPASSDKVSKNRVTLTYSLDGVTGTVEGTDQLYIKFSRTTGALTVFGPSLTSDVTGAVDKKAVITATCSNIDRSVSIVISTGSHNVG